ncbi:MAG: class I SAM-dependent methyltransferase [Deltaproteobacteria bacterium]|nr:class I SAM-dependent methyltransferase [Deltaproteobacteria bacterium]
MRRPEFIARQAGCPSGLFGRFFVWIMAAETAAVNEKALELLELKPNDRVLEVGFGHGRTLARAAALVPAGFVAGIDVSEEMVRMARRRNRQCIKEGRVEAQLADGVRIPYPDECFDRVFAVHTLYFWHDPRVHLQEIYRVMKPGARFVLGFSPKEDERTVVNFPATVYRFYTSGEVHSMFEEAGFIEVHMVCYQISSRDIVLGVAHRRTCESTAAMVKNES